MSDARSEIHDWGDCEGFESAECRRVDDLLNKVEDDRAHAEAEKLRTEAKLFEQDGYMDEGGIYEAAAAMIDPYEMRDGQLVRKSDGKPVTI